VSKELLHASHQFPARACYGARLPALFVLLPAGADADTLFQGAPSELLAARGALRLRAYPPATDARHLCSLVRASRDPVATRSLRGMVAAVTIGAVLGLLTNGLLAATMGVFGGLLEIALPLGFFVGAFLGGFTAAMTGTEVARDEVKALAAHVRPGCVLLQVVADDGRTLDLLRAHCEARSLLHTVRA
jgi:hypothetical protein